MGSSERFGYLLTQYILVRSSSDITKMFGLGELPKEYNPKVHGPYDPAVYYGPRYKGYKSFGEVKLGELPSFLASRNKSPAGIGRAMSRAYWRWSHKYVLPKYTGLAPCIQLIVGSCVVFYVINAGKYWSHRNYKHQW